MRLSDFKQAWSLYKLHEMTERHSDHTDVSFKGHRVGTIKYEDYTAPGFPIKEIPLLIVESKSYSEFFAGSFTDGEIFIAAKKECLELYTNTLLKATIAHEVGHVISGHFEKGYKNKGVMAFAAKAMAVIAYYNKVNTDKSYHKANIEIMKSLFRGSISQTEIEADMAANKFVPKQDIIYIHSDSLGQPNPFASLEKRNRINFISRNFPEGSERPEGFFKLEIHFNNGLVI
jgi:hypothetical protein